MKRLRSAFADLPQDPATLKADMQAAGWKITAFSMHNRFDLRPEETHLKNCQSKV